jgi:hypothetical protein
MTANASSASSKISKAPPSLQRGTPAWDHFESTCLLAGGMTPLDRAREIACAVHAGQTDQTGDPYLGHVRGVVELTSRLNQFQQLSIQDQEFVIQAAWLHDTLEDTPLEAADLRRAGFDPRVVETVEALSNPPDESREAYYHRILQTGALALCVKLGDLSHNTLPERRESLPGSPSNPLPPELVGDPERDRWTRLGRKYHAAYKALGAAVPAHLQQFG